jgi:hypothetical protein
VSPEESCNFPCLFNSIKLLGNSEIFMFIFIIIFILKTIFKTFAWSFKRIIFSCCFPYELISLNIRYIFLSDNFTIWLYWASKHVLFFCWFILMVSWPLC